MKKKVIYLAITSGCSACALMEHIWKEVLSNRKNVELVVSHFEDLPTYIKTNVPITDFPISIVTEDDRIRYHFEGTKPKLYIKTIFKDIDY